MSELCKTGTGQTANAAARHYWAASFWSQSLVTWGLLICVALFARDSYAGHPTHVSRGEIEYNADTQCLEFAVCLYEEDVRTVLGRMTTQSVDLTNNDRFSPLLAEYLHQNFFVATMSRQEMKITWYGYELGKEGVWIYFEVPLPGDPEDLVIGNRMMLEVQPGNVSDFRFRWGDRRATMVFNSQTAARKLVWEARKPTSAPLDNLSLTLSSTLGGHSGKQVLIPARDAPPRPLPFPTSSRKRMPSSQR